jgi:hypothetical protein
LPRKLNDVLQRQAATTIRHAPWREHELRWVTSQHAQGVDAANDNARIRKQIFVKISKDVI